jgi:TPR repeat protein
VAKDEGKGVQYYKTEADQGHAKAEFKLALCYENGIGVSKDEGKAVKCLHYKMAA